MNMDLKKLHLDWGSSRYKGKVYRSYSLARSVWKDGKNLKEPILKLGKLTDSEVQQWRSILQALKGPDCFLTSFKDIFVEKHFAFLDIAIANAIWEEFKLDQVFNNDGKRLISVANVARILSINRCIAPTSKSRTPQWFRKTALPWLLDIKPNEINSSRIFRELAVIEGFKDALCGFVFKKFSLSDPTSMKSVFYDLSSISFEGSKCKIMKWGHCKGGYENHVVLALVTNRVGIPFYWEVLPGCTADVSTITWLLNGLKKKFNLDPLKDTTFVFDRGMVSDDNLVLLEKNEIKYISAMDKNQIENITEINFSQFLHFRPEQVASQADDLTEFKKIDKNTYCREIRVIGKRRYILCFNPQLYKDQHNARQKALANYRIFVDNLNSELLNAKKSRQKEATYSKFTKKASSLKLNNFTNVHLKKTNACKVNSNSPKISTYQGNIVVDDHEMQLAGRKDGFWLLVTNHCEKDGQDFKLETKDTIAPYREKETIEEAFKDIKSFVEIEPTFVWTEAHVKAHYTICVLAYLINRIITLRLHNDTGSDSKEIVSHNRLFQETAECKLDYIEVKNIKQKKINITKVTQKQKDLLKRIGLSKLANRKIIDIANKKLIYAE